jgi:predicted DNA-binding protein (UPF0251 family)
MENYRLQPIQLAIIKKGVNLKHCLYYIFLIMVRPRICRKISSSPHITYFKPQGIPLVDLDEVILNLDEFEALKLKDVEGLGQEDGAKRMGISQPTFFRLISSAHKKIADAMVHGKAIRIEADLEYTVKTDQHLPNVKSAESPKTDDNMP